MVSESVVALATCPQSQLSTEGTARGYSNTYKSTGGLVPLTNRVVLVSGSHAPVSISVIGLNEAASVDLVVKSESQPADKNGTGENEHGFACPVASGVVAAALVVKSDSVFCGGIVVTVGPIPGGMVIAVQYQ
jgi:hypothetical protein